jgi:hypothetical protein
MATLHVRETTPIPAELHSRALLSISPAVGTGPVIELGIPLGTAKSFGGRAANLGYGVPARNVSKSRGVRPLERYVIPIPPRLAAPAAEYRYWVCRHGASLEFVLACYPGAPLNGLPATMNQELAPWPSETAALT